MRTMHHIRRKPRAAIPARVPATPPIIVPVLVVLEELAEEVVAGDRLDIGVDKVAVTSWVLRVVAWVEGVD